MEKTQRIYIKVLMVFGCRVNVETGKNVFLLHICFYRVWSFTASMSWFSACNLKSLLNVKKINELWSTHTYIPDPQIMLFCLLFAYHVDEKNISSQPGPLSVWLAGSPQVCLSFLWIPRFPPLSQPRARTVTRRVYVVPVWVSVGGRLCLTWAGSCLVPWVAGPLATCKPELGWTGWKRIILLVSIIRP